MCGIAGIIRREGLKESDISVATSFLEIHHNRGPDGRGIFRDHQSVHIQTLLSFQGTSKTLPFQDARYVITFNGEIYNYRSLREHLSRDYVFTSDTDTEVLLASWVTWGAACLDKLEGMFSFFIWDKKTAEGFAARDPLGVKPFFFIERDDLFAYSSTAGSFIESGLISFMPDESYLKLFLTAPYFSGALGTPFQGVKSLLPGEMIEVTKEGIKRSHFFTDSVQELDEEHLHEALSEAVESCFSGREKIGLFLSGGLDSTLIAGLAKKKNPLCFTLYYPENELLGHEHSLIVKSSDYPFALEAAKTLELPLKSVIVPVGDYRTSLLETLAGNDLICAWEQEVSQHILSKAAASLVKGVVVGDAADELHFGYPFFERPDIKDNIEHVLDWFGTVPLKNSSSAHIAETLREVSPKTDDLVRKLWLTRLLHNGDAHTMASSLEARVPFGMQKVIRASSGITSQVSYADEMEKSHLRRMASRYLPESLTKRKKSALTKSFAGQAIIHEEFIKALKHSSELIEDFVDLDEVRAWALRSPTTDREAGLEFRILALITWFRRYL
jgi:asparagine synthase (glutamine-hydrolysing)